MITGILLAAGQARRFGSAKLLHPLADGRPLGLASLQALQDVLPRVMVVVAPGQTALTDMYSAAGAHVIVCSQAKDGLGTSLACGVRAAPGEGWVIALGDMPLIHPHTIASVVAAIEGGAALAAPTYQGRRGHPVGFGQSFFADLCALQGDEGARGLVRARAEDLRLIPTDDPGVLFDVDRPSDLAVIPTPPLGTPLNTPERRPARWPQIIYTK